ncbi:hypothetical protein EJK55_1752 [Moraxella catarrhalis]|uniref:Uncharacterized protein n=1 Tax=Moraxella catarrhalis TaxID=480 RepID=A0A3Q9GAA6_MORCA|nr:hypothetical protein MCR_1427 [Moraxella catarrhalis BBH18]AZQ86738.1 hypothetical protein EJK52_1490 [Moraxella catarrhalis]EKF83384.1 hypothetical protein MCRH_1512 [Moraxella catarrhalis RH4]AZQ89618.1 hypothetical protein EJK50_1558 [Moraxella catarrhalis]AZQ91735.1 hypothetical protein EJK51_1489 [Moraxella catarrhalis]
MKRLDRFCLKIDGGWIGGINLLKPMQNLRLHEIFKLNNT